jgi:hypothetical protein
VVQEKQVWESLHCKPRISRPFIIFKVYLGLQQMLEQKLDKITIRNLMFLNFSPVTFKSRFAACEMRGESNNCSENTDTQII